MNPRTRTQTLAIIDRVLRDGPWHDPTWDERARRHGAAFLATLRGDLATLQPATAMASAALAARGEVPLSAAATHETWSRVSVAWCVRELVSAADDPTLDPAVATDLFHIATELSAAAPRLAAVENTALAAPFESLVEATRAAFVVARDDTDPRSPEGGYLAAFLHQLKHVASLLVVGGQSVDDLLRGAVQRADRVSRRDNLEGWVHADLETRRRWTRRGLLDASWALAARVAAHPGRDPQDRDAGLWLARSATQLAARVDKVDAWVQPAPMEQEKPRPEPAARAQTPTPSVVKVPEMPTKIPGGVTPPAKKERTMNEKITPVLKTLEADAGEAAWRLAGSQFVKLAREPIVALLSRHLAPDDASLRARIAAFLETELGSALLSSLLSVALAAVPVPQSDVTERLARELRVRAMAGAGDVVADVLMGPLRQVAVMYLQGIPAAGGGVEGGANTAQAIIGSLPGAANAETLKTETVTETAVSAAV